MSWKKYFKKPQDHSPLTPAGYDGGGDIKYAHWASRLPDVYVGHPNRIERYAQYENMDMDSEINAALDILAEFCTQSNVETGTPFDIHWYDEDPTDSEIKILRDELQTWCKINEFSNRLFKMFRNVIKYGDQIFIRDPETFEWSWVHMENVIKVIVNEAEGKEPEQYIIKDINPNFMNLTATQKSHTDNLGTSFTSSGQSMNTAYIQPQSGGMSGAGSRFEKQLNETAINSEHVVHCSLTEGLDVNWPFGNSILEQVFKVYKQKELIEDALIIYRVQRAPERRIFYIDVGNMPSHMAMSFVERVKNEIHQRRIPTQNGGGTNFMDATYNPLSINEDYFFPQTAEGRGSKVDTLPGGDNLGEINDLLYFTNKLFRGLRIPSSYLPTGPEESVATYNDGRLGTALIQEARFNEYCKRLQRLIADTFDQQFKMYLTWKGYNIDKSSFDLRFNEPQNFAAYRQSEIDSTRISVFSQLADIPYLSKRFVLKRYLGMTEEEMMENDKLWAEENMEPETQNPQGTDLRSVGITPGGIESDMDLADLGDEGMDMDMDIDNEGGDIDVGGEPMPTDLGT